MRQSIQECLSRPRSFKFFKGCLPQILLSPFLNTLSQLYSQKSFDYFLKGLNLDSDEDEMRIDYIREAREQDENNNDISSSSSRASLNLMQNIHFAELDNDDIQLSDSYLHKSDKSNDFLPKIEILEIDKSMEKTDSSLNERLYTLSDRKSDQGKLKDSYLSSVHSEYQRSEIESGKSRESSSSKSTSKGGHYSSSTLSSTNTKSKSSKDNSKSSSTKTLSKASSDKTSWHSVEKSEKSESGTLSETSDILSASASSRRSSRSTKSGKSTHRKKKSRRQNKAEKIFVKDNAAQTDFQDIDYTEHVLNFKYNWQSSEPSRIASHVIDGTTLDMLTNYSPAVLAANDMMKFHLDLMKKYIDSSRRLYEAYSSIDSTSNFRYTTIEDTLNYIKKNRPRVTNYEDALDHVTKESSR